MFVGNNERSCGRKFCKGYEGMEVLRLGKGRERERILGIRPHTYHSLESLESLLSSFSEWVWGLKLIAKSQCCAFEFISVR